ncbi:MAG: adaptor protein MecA [Clostridia bacterium]|nr:adaptor protein MecA [Clostridia bacterium]
MHIEQLEKNKVKVTLTVDDLHMMDIDISTLGNESVKLNTFLFNIMEKVKEETDFNPYGGQILMEAMPTAEGVSIFVSKVLDDDRKITKTAFKNVKTIRAKGVVSGTSEIDADVMELFYIENFDSVCSVLRELKYNTLLKCELYKLEDEYCMMVRRDFKSVQSMGVLWEFAKRRSVHSMQKDFVREHGTLIAKGRKLANMGKGVKSLY